MSATEAREALREAVRNVLHLCDCPPDWLMQDGSHARECMQSEPALVALRAALAALPDDGRDVDVNTLAEAMWFEGLTDGPAS